MPGSLKFRPACIVRCRGRPPMAIRMQNWRKVDFADSRRVKLSDLKGKVVVIDFWATWCSPCVKSVPTLVQLYEKYRARGLEILSITVDEQADLYKIAPFAKEYQIAYPVLLDAGAKE